MLGALEEKIIDGNHGDHEQNYKEDEEACGNTFSRALVTRRKSRVIARVTKSISPHTTNERGDEGSK